MMSAFSEADEIRDPEAGQRFLRNKARELTNRAPNTEDTAVIHTQADTPSPPLPLQPPLPVPQTVALIHI